MAHNRLVDTAAAHNKKIATQALQYRNADTDFCEWAEGYGLVCHSDATQLAVYDLAHELTDAGYVAHPTLCFRLLRQLDVLCNHVIALVARLTQLRDFDAAGDGIRHLRPQAAGDTRRALAVVPVLCARLALNRLTRHHRDWFTDIADAGAALEVLQLLLETAPADRRSRYGSRADDIDWEKMIRDFGRVSENQSFPGPWISPELAGVRAPVGGSVASQAVHQVLASERLLALLDAADRETLQDSLRWWHPADCGLLVPLLMNFGASDSDTTLVDGSDPAACACAIFNAETRLGMLAEQYLDEEWPGARSVPVIEVNAAGWWQNANSPDERQQALAQMLARCGEDEAVSMRAVAAMKPNRRSSRAFMVTPNRPDPHWVSHGESCLQAIDRYFGDLAEVNPQLRARIAGDRARLAVDLPLASELLGGRSEWPLQQRDCRPAGAVLAVDSGEEMATIVLGNQMGLNLLAPASAQAMETLGPLLVSSRFARAQAAVDEPAPWLAIPFLLQADWWQVPDHGFACALECAEVMLAQNADQVRLQLPPDPNTALACLKNAYGEYGVITGLLLPGQTVATALNPKIAEQLAAFGAVCVAGNCAAEIQIVAIGAASLDVGREASERLKSLGITHSLVCVLEPGRFRDARDPQESAYLADPSLIDSLFPAHVQYRLILTDLRPELVLGHCRLLDSGRQRTRALGFTNHYPGECEASVLLANGLHVAPALWSLAQLTGRDPAEWLSAIDREAVQIWQKIRAGDDVL